MKPALTPEEWTAGFFLDREKEVSIDADGDVEVCNEDRDYGYRAFVSRRHALAALALYGQPFGFTREDVLILRKEAEYIEMSPGGGLDLDKPFLDLAARIEALLPPETL